MPIEIHGKTFDSFDEAVAYCMRTKGMSRDEAKKYVGAYEAKQNGE